MDEEYKGYTFKIEQDTDPIDPRGYDNLGTMVCFHKGYLLGDHDPVHGHGLKSEDFNGWEELEEHIRKKLKGHIILPLYLYDHSGITMNTTGYSCRFDSGQVGFIYITAKKMRQEMRHLNNSSNPSKFSPVKRISKKLTERVSQYLVNEVTEYDQYLTGDVWGYTGIEDPDGDHQLTFGNALDDVHDCWGYFGTESCIEDVKSIIDYDIKVKKELKKVDDTPLKKLPLLIGSLEFDGSKERLEERLKG